MINLFSKTDGFYKNDKFIYSSKISDFIKNDKVVW